MSYVQKPRPPITKYLRLIRKLKIKQSSHKPTIISMAAEQNTGITLIDKFSVKVYEKFNLREFDKLNVLRISCDAIITDQTVPILVTPADCMVITIFGRCKNTGKKFLITTHSGFTGSILDVTLNALNFAKTKYSFDFNSLEAYISPFIDGKQYTKQLDDPRVQMAFKKDKSLWEKYLIEQKVPKKQKDKNKVEVHFGTKVIDDLKSLKITVANSTHLEDTYEGNKAGTLFSNKYLKDNSLTYKSFGVLSMVR